MGKFSPLAAKIKLLSCGIQKLSNEPIAKLITEN